MRFSYSKVIMQCDFTVLLAYPIKLKKGNIVISSDFCNSGKNLCRSDYTMVLKFTYFESSTDKTCSYDYGVIPWPHCLVIVNVL